ncbi:hypothetical protein QR685DRAFT_536320 [Neurospora intermedia]|uniref:Secreted protein n=1 Tax=Neurospora intermedia TaxID=5142 RepID=A0ABR3D111_NEUIN
MQCTKGSVLCCLALMAQIIIKIPRAIFFTLMCFGSHFSDLSTGIHQRHRQTQDKRQRRTNEPPDGPCPPMSGPRRRRPQKLSPTSIPLGAIALPSASLHALCGFNLTLALLLRVSCPEGGKVCCCRSHRETLKEWFRGVMETSIV